MSTLQIDTMLFYVESSETLTYDDVDLYQVPTNTIRCDISEVPLAVIHRSGITFKLLTVEVNNSDRHSSVF